MNNFQTLILVVSVLLVGAVLGRLFSLVFFRYQTKQAENRAKRIVKDANMEAAKIKQEKILEAKERIVNLKSDFEYSVGRRQEKIREEEVYLKHREQVIAQQLEQIQRKEQVLDGLKAELEQLRLKRISQLEGVAQLRAEDAKGQLMEALEDEARSSAAIRIRSIVDDAKNTADKEAKKVILASIQRTASEQTIENSTAVVHLTDSALKGKVIGKEGRNIRALEAAAGVDLIVDDSPETILISSFDPIRREIAKLSLEQLIQDGRIHPNRIEEVVDSVERSIEKEIMNTGERTVIDLGIYGMHVELIKMIGKMRYRSSYGQNLLYHSREVARLAATMASELGLDSDMAKRAGLLHDIGKVVSGRPELSHALLGMELAEKYRENEEVCNAIGAHHDEIKMDSMLSPVIQACDAISGSRPGVRREVVEAYTRRLQDMENIALSFPGVKKCYAIQAGRELRVIVDAKTVADEEAKEIAFDISGAIERKTQYPGQIKVVVIREIRAINYAK